MKAACIQAVSQVLGGPLTKAEERDIEKRIAQAMRSLARQDPQVWMAKSAATKLREAGELAAQGIVAEKVRAQKIQALGILAQGRIMQHVIDSKARGIDTLNALDRVNQFEADGKSNFMSVETRTHAIESDALRQMIGTLEAANPKFFGLFANREAERLMEMELFGEDSGNADAKAGAKEFQAVAEQLRQAKNDAGGNVNKLEDWGRPHDHSQSQVAKATRDVWVADTLPLLNRRRYINEDGSRMTDAELSDFLSHAWESIATGGANKVDPGQFRGTGARANRGSEHRQIHFKDSASFAAYRAKYGEKTLYQSLLGHIQGAARDVALTEIWGPNPDQTFRYMKEALAQESTLADPTKTGDVATRAARSQSLFDVVSGKTQPVGSERMAKAFDTLRAWLIASRLGSAVITSFSDDATMHLTGRINQLPEMRLLANELAAFNPANRGEERRALLAGLTFNTVLSNMNRFAIDDLGSGFTRALPNAVLRASGLTAMTAARKRAFGVTMYGELGNLVSKNANLKALDASDYRILLGKGISDVDWQVWRRAQLEDWGDGNTTMLTPESVYRIPDAQLKQFGDPAKVKREAALKLLGSVLEESDVAVVEPGVKERMQMGASLQRGTLKGELMKSFFLFKSYPLAMIERHVVRGMSMPNAGGRAAYLASLFAATTVLGMASLQVDQVLQGKDPRNMDPTEGGGIRNWLAAALKGGSLGIYGDLLFSDTTQHGNSPMATLTGPLLGTAEDLFNLTQGNVVQYLHGQPTHAPAELVRFVKGNTPGASLWYAKAALDHLIFQRLQEYFSPGYLATVRSRTEREFGQNYWWDPGQPTPDRAPDLGAAVGE